MSESERAALEEQKRKNQAAIDLIQRLMEDESDDGEEWLRVEPFLEELSRERREPLPEHKEAA